MNVENVPLDKIDIVENIRVKEDPEIKQLMESIKQHGLIEPIGVGSTKSGKYVLMYGYRRYLAYKKLGYKTIPAVLETEPELPQLLIINTLENIQRKEITPIELGRICLRLYELGLTPGEMAAKIGLSKLKVEAALEAYKHIPEYLRTKIRFMPAGHSSKKGDIPASVAYEVLTLRRKYNLSNTQLTDLLEETRKEELSSKDLRLLGALMNTGISPAKAIKMRRDYMVMGVDLLLEKDVIEKLVKKHDMKPNEIFRGIISGKLKPVPLFSDSLKFLTRKKDKGDKE